MENCLFTDIETSFDKTVAHVAPEQGIDPSVRPHIGSSRSPIRSRARPYIRSFVAEPVM